MLNALSRFNASVADAEALSDLYETLKNIVPALKAEDLLRYQMVYSLSAFDKLIHDLIRIGIMHCFNGARSATQKYRSETISIELHENMNSATVPPKEYYFEQAIYEKLKVLSFQDPDKVAAGLAYVWAEPHKWQSIAIKLGMDVDDAKTRLKLIASRRNAIVHEADMDPITNTQTPLSKTECSAATSYLKALGNAIGSLVL